MTNNKAALQKVINRNNEDMMRKMNNWFKKKQEKEKQAFREMASKVLNQNANSKLFTKNDPFMKRFPNE